MNNFIEVNIAVLLELIAFVLVIFSIYSRLDKLEKQIKSPNEPKHKCNYVLISKTFKVAGKLNFDFGWGPAPNLSWVNEQIENNQPKTSFFYKCSDPSCNKTFVETLLGEEISEES